MSHKVSERNLQTLFNDTLFKVERIGYWVSRLRVLCCLSEWKGVLFKKRSESLFKTLLQEVVIAGAKLKTDKLVDDPRIFTALQIIEKEYHLNLSVESLSERCGLKTVRFRELFKQYVNQEPRRYLISYRMRQAQSLLLNTDFTIKEIALATGFQNDYYFCASFKKHNQLTPTQYRKRNQP